MHHRSRSAPQCSDAGAHDDNPSRDFMISPRHMLTQTCQHVGVPGKCHICTPVPELLRPNTKFPDHARSFHVPGIMFRGKAAWQQSRSAKVPLHDSEGWGTRQPCTNQNPDFLQDVVKKTIIEKKRPIRQRGTCLSDFRCDLTTYLRPYFLPFCRHLLDAKNVAARCRRHSSNSAHSENALTL